MKGLGLLFAAFVFFMAKQREDARSGAGRGEKNTGQPQG